MIRNIAELQDNWGGLLSVSVVALAFSPRDRSIGSGNTFAWMKAWRSMGKQCGNSKNRLFAFWDVRSQT